MILTTFGRSPYMSMCVCVSLSVTLCLCVCVHVRMCAHVYVCNRSKICPLFKVTQISSPWEHYIFFRNRKRPYKWRHIFNFKILDTRVQEPKAPPFGNVIRSHGYCILTFPDASTIPPLYPTKHPIKTKQKKMG